MKPLIKNIIALEPLLEKKATLYQRVSQLVLKWPIKRFTDRQTNKCCIYNRKLIGPI